LSVTQPSAKVEKSFPSGFKGIRQNMANIATNLGLSGPNTAAVALIIAIAAAATG
jgi:hypothetical protein